MNAKKLFFLSVLAASSLFSSILKLIFSLSVLCVPVVSYLFQYFFLAPWRLCGRQLFSTAPTLTFDFQLSTFDLYLIQEEL